MATMPTDNTNVAMMTAKMATMATNNPVIDNKQLKFNLYIIIAHECYYKLTWRV